MTLPKHHYTFLIPLCLSSLRNLYRSKSCAQCRYLPAINENILIIFVSYCVIPLGLYFHTIKLHLLAIRYFYLKPLTTNSGAPHHSSLLVMRGIHNTETNRPKPVTRCFITDSLLAKLCHLQRGGLFRFYMTCCCRQRFAQNSLDSSDMINLLYWEKTSTLLFTSLRKDIDLTIGLSTAMLNWYMVYNAKSSVDVPERTIVKTQSLYNWPLPARIHPSSIPHGPTLVLSSHHAKLSQYKSSVCGLPHHGAPVNDNSQEIIDWSIVHWWHSPTAEMSGCGPCQLRGSLFSQWCCYFSSSHSHSKPPD